VRTKTNRNTLSNVAGATHAEGRGDNIPTKSFLSKAIMLLTILVIAGNLMAEPFSGWQRGIHNGTGGNNVTAGMEFQHRTGTEVRVRRGNLNAANSGNRIEIPSHVTINDILYTVTEIPNAPNANEGLEYTQTYIL